MAVAQALLNGLGYTGTHFRLVQAGTAEALDAALQSLAIDTRQQLPAAAARYAVTPEKRSTLDLAIDHLVAARAAETRRGGAARRCAGRRFTRWGPSRSTRTVARFA